MTTPPAILMNIGHRRGIAGVDTSTTSKASLWTLALRAPATISKALAAPKVTPKAAASIVAACSR